MRTHPPRPEENPDFDPDLAWSDMSADFGLAPDRDDEAPDCGFDVGTSPHGLSAELPLSYQETPEAARRPLPAKPVLPLLDEDSEAQAFEDQEAISGLLDGGRHE
jgi:hypothetical protein